MTRKEADRLVRENLAVWLGKDTLQYVNNAEDLLRYGDPGVILNPVVCPGTKTVIRFG